MPDALTSRSSIRSSLHEPWRAVGGRASFCALLLSLILPFCAPGQSSGVIIIPDSVFALIRDSKGGIVAGNAEGILRLDDRSDSLAPIAAFSGARNILSLALSRTGTLYAGSREGFVYRLDPGAQKAARTSIGYPVAVTALISDVSGNLLVGTDGEGLISTSDSGRTWGRMGTGLEDPHVNAMARLSNGDLLVGTRRGLFRSSDGGESWFRIARELPRMNVLSILEQGEGTVWMGATGALFRSRDGGLTWTGPESGLPQGNYGALASIGDSTVFAGVSDAFGGARIYRHDRGETGWGRMIWETEARQVTAFLPLDSRSIVASGNRGYRESQELKISTALMQVTKPPPVPGFPHKRRSAFLLEYGEAIGGCSGDVPMFGIGYAWTGTKDSLFHPLFSTGSRLQFNVGYFYLQVQVALRLKFDILYVLGGIQFGYTANRDPETGGAGSYWRTADGGRTLIEAYTLTIGVEFPAIYLEFQSQFLAQKWLCHGQGGFTRDPNETIQPEEGGRNILGIIGFRF